MYRRYIKRILDFVFALFALPFILIVCVIFGPIIWLEDRGTVFYRAKRRGMKGKFFFMYKLRSMKMNAPDIRNKNNSTFNSASDPRVTKIGKLIRKTSIDELPQVFNVLKGDMSFLDKLEEEMSTEEENILSGEKKKDALAEISRWRKELLRLKRYYEQLDVIFDEMSANDNGLLEKRTLKRISILGARVDRYLMTVRALQDIVNQMCDVYQSQLSIEQNDLMKIFTIITSVFLPLTLITGWYGMNFKVIPELDWKYGYPCVIAASIVIVLILLWFFKRRKWI